MINMHKGDFPAAEPHRSGQLPMSLSYDMINAYDIYPSPVLPKVCESVAHQEGQRGVVLFLPFHVPHCDTWQTREVAVVDQIADLDPAGYGIAPDAQEIVVPRFPVPAADRIDRFGESDALLRLIAREELIENGNWCSYQRDNTADFNL